MKRNYKTIRARQDRQSVTYPWFDQPGDFKRVPAAGAVSPARKMVDGATRQMIDEALRKRSCGCCGSPDHTRLECPFWKP
jgi:hypothetical protein